MANALFFQRHWQQNTHMKGLTGSAGEIYKWFYIFFFILRGAAKGYQYFKRVNMKIHLV
jgi:hypothetical protein